MLQNAASVADRSSVHSGGIYHTLNSNADAQKQRNQIFSAGLNSQNTEFGPLHNYAEGGSVIDSNSVNSKIKPARKIRIRGRQVDNQSITIGKENSSAAIESIQMSESRGPLSREYPILDEEAKPNQFNVDLHV